MTGSADKQNAKVDQHISIVGVVFRSMYNACVPSFLFVQFKFLVDGLSLVPRPLPDFISQPWRKIREKAWDQNYVTDQKWWTRLVQTESTISGP